MATTVNYALPLPINGADEDNWGTNGLNAGLVLIDTEMKVLEVAAADAHADAALKLPLAGGVMTGKIDLHSTRTAVVAAGNLTGTHTFDLAAGDAYTATVTGAVTLTFTPVAGAGKMSSFVVQLTNGGAGAVTFPVTVKWADGSAPTLTASGVDLLAFITFDAGTTWLGMAALAFEVPA